MAMIGGYRDSDIPETYPRPRSSEPTPGAPESAPPQPTAPASAPASSAPPPQTSTPAPWAARYGYEGYNRDKLLDPTHKSAKYQIGRTLIGGFDPRQGFTPEAIAALNGLGFGTFSGSGQKLSLRGLTDAGRAAGLLGDYTDADFIKGFDTGNGIWHYSDPYAESLSAPTYQPGTASMFPGFGEGFSGQQAAQQPSFNFTYSGIDPSALTALASMIQQPQTQYVQVPSYQPSAPQTVAPPMAMDGPSAGSAVQTQAAGTQAAGIDPLMAWLRAMLGGR